MAKSTLQSIGKAANEQKPSPAWKFPFGKMNIYFILAGVATILLGYLLMSTGITEDAATVDGKWNSALVVSVAPIILLIGYCVLIPMGILKNFDSKAENEK